MLPKQKKDFFSFQLQLYAWICMVLSLYKNARYCHEKRCMQAEEFLWIAFDINENVPLFCEFSLIVWNETRFDGLYYIRLLAKNNVIKRKKLIDFKNSTSFCCFLLPKTFSASQHTKSGKFIVFLEKLTLTKLALSVFCRWIFAKNNCFAIKIRIDPNGLFLQHTVRWLIAFESDLLVWLLRSLIGWLEE